MRHRNLLDIYTKVVPCSVQDVLTFHSSRKTFIRGVPGRIIVIVAAWGFRDAGPAFTIGAASFMQPRWANTTFSAAVSMLSVGFLDQTVQAQVIAQHPGSSIAGGLDADLTSIVGKSLVSGTGGNVDYTGVGSPITLVFLYRLLPVTLDRISAITAIERVPG